MSPRASAVLRDLLPPQAYAFEHDLSGAESATTSARQREFHAGRDCAHAALQRLGVGGAVGRRPDRSPDWPPGSTGSIAHCPHLAVAVAGPDQHFAGLGVDLEDPSAVTVDLAAMVLTGREPEQVLHNAATMLPLVFSMKESAYKCWYPLTGVALDFIDIEVSVDVDAGEFRATMVTSARHHPAHVPTRGRFTRHRGHVYTAAWIVRDASRPAVAGPVTARGSG